MRRFWILYVSASNHETCWYSEQVRTDIQWWWVRLSSQR